MEQDNKNKIMNQKNPENIDIQICQKIEHYVKKYLIKSYTKILNRYNAPYEIDSQLHTWNNQRPSCKVPKGTCS